MALGKELRMTIRALSKRGCSRRAIARAARVSERQVRYELRREEGRRDRRAKVERASSLEGVIQEWCGGIEEGRALNATALHEHLVTEHGYVGSLRSVQRYLRRRPGPGRVRARRRVETPPGAQAQADWAHAPRMRVGGRQGVYGFVLRLSYSRKNAVVWSERKDTLSWLWAHGQAFSRLKARWRLGGMPVNRIGTADVMAVLLPIWAENLGGEAGDRAPGAAADLRRDALGSRAGLPGRQPGRRRCLLLASLRLRPSYTRNI